VGQVGQAGQAGQVGQAGQAGALPNGPTPLEEARRQAALKTFDDVRTIGLIAVAGLTVVAIGASWAVAGKVVQPVTKVTETARSISADTRLDRRIRYQGADDELHELADSFDAMLDRLEKVFDGQRSFVSNTSHELRTPIAVMQAEVDVALDDPGADEASLRRSLEAVRDELRHTTGLVGAMLGLARAEAITDPTTVDLAAAAQRAVELLPLDWVAEHRVQVSARPAPVSGDPVLLRQLVGNLVTNARKYNVAGGLLSVRTATADGHAELVVENDGPVVAPETLESLFGRFVRRSEAGEGYGLGLAIVHAIVTTHDGVIEATARPEGGLRVVVRLPLADVAAPASVAGAVTARA
jgi:signal transduction histidine kinase